MQLVGGKTGEKWTESHYHKKTVEAGNTPKLMHPTCPYAMYHLLLLLHHHNKLQLDAFTEK